MRLFVGLGNPGQKYQNTRHNIGFMAMDELVHRHKFSGWSQKFQSEISTGTLDGEKIIVLKPQTFMNLSGDAVQAAASFYKIAPEDIIVFHDELALLPGRMRMKKGGGAGGHNGLRSIDDRIGQEYWRVRIGIGHPGDRDMVSPYVLGDFVKADAEWIKLMLETMAKEAGLIVKGDMDEYMNRIAIALQPPKPVRPPKELKEVQKEKSDGL